MLDCDNRPSFLLTDVETVWVHKGKHGFGGGNNNLLIHTDQGEEYVRATNETNEALVQREHICARNHRWVCVFGVLVAPCGWSGSNLHLILSVGVCRNSDTKAPALRSSCCTGRYIKDNVLEECFVHESTHTSMDPNHAHAAGWVQAQEKDGGAFLSAYGRDHPRREDLAESMGRVNMHAGPPHLPMTMLEDAVAALRQHPP